MTDIQAYLIDLYKEDSSFGLKWVNVLKMTQLSFEEVARLKFTMANSMPCDESIISKIQKYLNVPKLVFLDLDGVINGNDEDSLYQKGKLSDDQELYSDVLVERLNRLLDETGAKVVLSSTWRLGLSQEQIEYRLADIGIKCDCIGFTPNFYKYSVRGNEIRAWIIDNEELLGCDYRFRNYVIIDDDSDMLLWQKDNFVNTNGMKGLTDEDCELAKSIFEKFKPYI